MTVLRVPYTRFPTQPSEAFPTHTTAARPALKVLLSANGRVLPFSFLSIIDSGADHCVFPAIFGRQLGINIEAGRKVFSSGIAGSSITYFHPVEVIAEIGGNRFNFNCYAGFMTSMDALGLGLLGHHGFFSLFQSISFDSGAEVVEFATKRPPSAPAAARG